MTRQRIRSGVFRSIADLQATINAYLAEHNDSPKPFIWAKSAEAIMAKLDRCPVPSVLTQCTQIHPADSVLSLIVLPGPVPGIHVLLA